MYKRQTTASVFDPFVVMIEDRYRLFVSERKNSGIICTDSTDGTEWEKWKVALEAGDKGSWEERVNRASVCKIDGKWLMWYTGPVSYTHLMQSAGRFQEFL